MDRVGCVAHRKGSCQRWSSFSYFFWRTKDCVSLVLNDVVECSLKHTQGFFVPSNPQCSSKTLWKFTYTNSSDLLFEFVWNMWHSNEHSCFAFTLGWLLLHVLPSLCCALSCAFLGYSRWGTAGCSRDPLPCTLRTVKGCLLTPYTWHPKATWDFCLVSDFALLSPLKEQSLASLFCKGRMFLAFWNTSRHPSRNVTHLYKICFYCKTQNVSTLEEFDIHSKLLG